MTRKSDIITLQTEVPHQQTKTAGHFKSYFPRLLDIVQHGEDVIISYGKKKEKIAVLVPYDRYEGKPQRILGLFADKASVSIPADFKVSDDELLSL